MSITQAERATTRQERELGLIDCDVHNALKSRDVLKKYLPARWHLSYDQGSHVGSHAGLVLGAKPQPNIFRGDSHPAGGPPGSDLDLMREQLFDRYDVRKAIVHPVVELLGFPQYGEQALAFTAALNDWMIDEWLHADERVYGAISVPIEDGQRAASEIERVAGERRFVKVMLPIVTREGLGHPKYWPIYEAAAAHELPIAAHVGGFSGVSLSAGWPSYFVEHHASHPQSYVAQVVSLVCSGVFDRFPRLRFVLEEGGVAWLPSLMWRLDRAWESQREQLPDLTQRPSQTIRQHFWFTTQPLDEPEKPEYLPQLLDQLAMDDRIMFASDYPHWDFDDPARVLPASSIGAHLREKILSRNAADLFRFDPEAA